MQGERSAGVLDLSQKNSVSPPLITGCSPCHSSLTWARSHGRVLVTVKLMEKKGVPCSLNVNCYYMVPGITMRKTTISASSSQSTPREKGILCGNDMIPEFPVEHH